MIRRFSARLLRRLDRIAEVVEGWRAAREQEEKQRQARLRFADMLREGLHRAGIDSATVPAMRRYDEPEPSAGPPPPAVARPPGPVELFLSRVAELARRCRADPPPLDRATPM